jgi:hypothetical protein
MTKGRGAAPPAGPARTLYTAKGRGSANGFACTKYDGMRGAEKIDELCAADPSELKFAASDFQVYEKMKEFLVGFQNLVASGSSAWNPAPSGFSGFPVQQITYKDGKPAWRSDTKVIEHATFSDADFSLGNAKKVDVPGQPRGKQ